MLDRKKSKRIRQRPKMDDTMIKLFDDLRKIEEAKSARTTWTISVYCAFLEETCMSTPTAYHRQADKT